MSCEGMGPLLSRYADNEVSPDERTRVDLHVASCRECREELNIFRANERLVSEALAAGLSAESLVVETLRELEGAVSDQAGSAESGAGPAKGAGPAAGGIRARFVRFLAASAGALARVAAVIFFFVSVGLAYYSYVLRTTLNSIEPRLNNIAITVDRLAREQAQLTASGQKATEVGSHRPVRNIVEVPRDNSDPSHAIVTQEEGDGGTAAGGSDDTANTGSVPPESEAIHSFDVSNMLPEKVYAFWTLNAKTVPPDAKFYLYRRAPDQESYDEVATGLADSTTSFIDSTVRSATPYEYFLQIDAPRGTHTRSRAVSIKTLPDMEVTFQGTATIEKQNPVAVFKIRKRVDGRWVSQVFSVGRDEPIGGMKYAPELRKDVDFSTAYVLAELEDAERRKLIGYEKKKIRDENGDLRDVWEEKFNTESIPRATLDNGSGDQFSLWNGQAVTGARGSLRE
ncbi:MAG: zf-HC2 domain-containing protein [Planctomycetota bacterium]|nr:zf-HC2 domain-containing protein [Planctomycetota bacterium]